MEEQRSRHLRRHPSLTSGAVSSSEDMQGIHRARMEEHESWMHGETIRNYNRWLGGAYKGDHQKAHQLRRSAFFGVCLPDHRQQARGAGIHSASDMQCCTACSRRQQCCKAWTTQRPTFGALPDDTSRLRVGFYNVEIEVADVGGKNGKARNAC